MTSALATAMGRPRWIAARFLPGLGAVFGIRAAPRCPVTYCRVVALRLWARGRGCGPAAGHARQPGQPKVAAAAALSNSSGRKKLKFWRSSLKN